MTSVPIGGRYFKIDIGALARSRFSISSEGRTRNTVFKKLIVSQEILMMRIVERITDEPEWDRKVGNFGAQLHIGH